MSKSLKIIIPIVFVILVGGAVAGYFYWQNINPDVIEEPLPQQQVNSDNEQVQKEVDKTIDSDGDGLTDYDEINIYGTDPNNPDTDGDGYSDGDEVKNGYSPLESSSSRTFTIRVEEPPSGGVYQGEMKITIASEDLSILKLTSRTFNIVGIPAFPKTAFCRRGVSCDDKISGASEIFRDFIGPTYILNPTGYNLKQVANIKLCYTPEMVGYSSDIPLDESKAKFWLGIGNTGVIVEPQEVDVINHCISGTIKSFPEFGFGIIVQPEIKQPSPEILQKALDLSECKTDKDCSENYSCECAGRVAGEEGTYACIYSCQK